MQSSYPASSDAGTLAQAFHDSDLLIRPTWDSWMQVQAPYATVEYETREVTTRFHRNGYDWDVHGTLLMPKKETAPGVAFVMTHGGASSEYELLETPDGRPGVAVIAASQGFPVLVVTWVGHHHPEGRWTAPVADRMPIYLFDRELPEAEVADRMLRCTYNVTVDGWARLADEHLADRKLLAFGHSTSGPMSVSLQSFLRKCSIAGIFGWGSGGPDGWFLEWLRWVGVKKENVVPIEHIARRTTASFRKQGYEGDAELCPWGGAEGFMRWSDEFRSQLKTSVCENQHKANIPILREYAKLTGLPEAEFIDHLYDPDPVWMAKTPVLLMCGERDVNHWYYGEGDEEKLEVFMGRKFEQRNPWTKVILLQRHAHYGHVELYNEKIVYMWLWAFAEGFFDAALKA